MYILFYAFTLYFVILRDPMDYTAHGILQARILEWVDFPTSRGSSQPRDRTQVSLIAGEFFTSGATREALELPYEPASLLLGIYLGEKSNLKRHVPNVHSHIIYNCQGIEVI